MSEKWTFQWVYFKKKQETLLYQGFIKFKDFFSFASSLKFVVDFSDFHVDLFYEYYPNILFDFMKENPSKPVDVSSQEFYNYFSEKFDFILTIEFIKYQQNFINKLPNERVNSNLSKEELEKSLKKWVKMKSRQDLHQHLEEIMQDLNKVEQLKHENEVKMAQFSDTFITNKSSNQSEIMKVNDDSSKEKENEKFQNLVQHFEQTGQNLRKIEEQWQTEDKKKADLIGRLGMCSAIGKNIPHSAVSSSRNGFTKF